MSVQLTPSAQMIESDLKNELYPQTPDEATRIVLDGLQRARLMLSELKSIGQTNYGIRISFINDAEKLALLYQESFPGYPFASLVHTKEGHQKFLGDLSQLRAVVVNEGRLVGAAALGTIPPDRSGEIKQVVVHPEFRGKELCLPLLKCLIKAGELANLQYLYLDIRARILPMQKAALEAGFRAVGFRVGQHIVYHPEGPRREHMIHMIKLLNGAQKDLDKKELQNIDPTIVNQLKGIGVNPDILLGCLI